MLNTIFHLGTPSDIHSEAESYTYGKFVAFVRSVNYITLTISGISINTQIIRKTCAD